MMRPRTLSRKEAAESLGISMATLRRREGKTIHPFVTELGEHRFLPTEVVAAAFRMPPTKTQPRISAERAASLQSVAAKLSKPTPRTDDPTRKLHGARLARFRAAIAEGATVHELRKRFNLSQTELYRALVYA